MKSAALVALVALAVTTLTAAGALLVGAPRRDPEPSWTWDLPPRFPIPRVPADNPMSAAKVELGRHLFYDPRLSVTGRMSCASCHQQALAFTDGKPHAEGATGEAHPRGSMSLVNVAYGSRFGWAHPLLDTLEAQALLPMFGERPVEMGLAELADDRLAMLRADGRYARLFTAAWPDDPAPISWRHVVQAIACFERALVSARSPYDRFMTGDESALSESARRGLDLFLSERLECFHCHGGFNFSDAVDHRGMAAAEVAFHNNGLYDLDGRGACPRGETGVHEISGAAADMGRFKAPTLRNIAVTAPYMHDGSLATLEDVLAHYERGGRRLTTGPHAGDGAGSPLKSEFVPGFVLTDAERRDVIAFLHSLTDEALLSDPRFGNPVP